MCAGAVPSLKLQPSGASLGLSQPKATWPRAISADTAGRSLTVCGRMTHGFAGVHSDRETHKELCARVGTPLVRAVLEGYNGSLIMYGQHGTGKTHCFGEYGQMNGAAEGLAARMLRRLYAEAAAAAREHTYSFQMQAVHVRAGGVVARARVDGRRGARVGREVRCSGGVHRRAWREVSRSLRRSEAIFRGRKAGSRNGRERYSRPGAR